MKLVPKIIFPLAVVFAAGLSGCSKPAAADKPADAPDKSGVTIDAETQTRIGLKIESPVAAQWQPEVKGYGVVVDPATVASALMNLETARAAADVSGKELERLKTLADNVSARTLESAKSDAQRDSEAQAYSATGALEDALQSPADDLAGVLKKISTVTPQAKASHP